MYMVRDDSPDVVRMSWRTQHRVVPSEAPGHWSARSAWGSERETHCTFVHMYIQCVRVHGIYMHTREYKKHSL